MKFIILDLSSLSTNTNDVDKIKQHLLVEENNFGSITKYFSKFFTNQKMSKTTTSLADAKDIQKSVIG